MKNIGFLVHGGGTNLQAAIDEKNNGNIKGVNFAIMISDNKEAYALERARQNNINTIVILRDDYPLMKDFNIAILNIMKRYNVDFIVAAGWLSRIDEVLIDAYENKIINIHPALLPKYGGKGMYGLNVHKAVLDSGDKVTGATVHIVTTTIDGGAIILQKEVEVKNNDTAETLQRRVMEEAEWIILPKVINMFGNNQIEIKGKKVRIKEC